MSVVSLPNIAAPFSAFRSIPSRATDDMLDKDRLVPIDATLIPNDLMQSFAIPLLSFDQREAPVTGAVLQPPFELPLAFSGPEHPRQIAQVEEPAIAADESPAAQHFHPIEAIVVANSSGADNTKPLHKPRVVWTDELHQRFLRAIDAAGSDEAAVPTVILKLMNVSGLSRDNVASHLQKHRLGLKRGKSRKRRLSAMQGPRSKQGKGSDGMMTLTSLDQELMEQDGTQAGAAADAEEQAEGIAKSCEASKTASEMPQNGRSREGDGNDCEGSNGRDDCDANEGPASDDGAGAGSDNRTACNVSGMDQGGEMAPHGSHAGEGHSPGAGEGHRVADETGLSACPLKADGALGSSGDGSQEQKNAEASPFHSRSGSNLASKQQITSNGASGVNGSGSEPTEGSRVNGAGQSTDKGATPPMSHAHLTRHAATGDQMAAMISTSMPPASAGQSLATQSSGARRSGGMTFGEMLPVGIPIQLPCDIQVPAGNTKRICAPKTGDGSWPA